MSDEKKELKPLSKKHQRVQDEYLVCFNQTRAYMAVYTSVEYDSAKTASARLFANDNFSAHLQARLSEAHMNADEALARETEIGRTGVGFFFKIVDEWMFNPLPEYEILDERSVLDDTKDPPEKTVSYRVRHAVLDMDKVVDPQYRHLIKSFSNSRRSGLRIELYDAQEVHNNVLKMAGKFKNPGTEDEPLNVRVIEVVKTK